MDLTLPALRTPKEYVFLVLMLLCFRPSATAQNPVHPYRTPQAIALQSSLKAAWDKPLTKQPLLSIAQEWSIAYGIPIWIDRRIATDQRIDIDIGQTTVGEVMQRVADSLGVEVAIFDRVVAFVPNDRADCLQRAYWSLATSPLDAGLLRAERYGMEWEDGASANDLILEFFRRYRISAEGIGPWENDLWRSQRWENVAPAAVGLCLLCGYDLTLEAQGKAPRIRPLCDPQPNQPVAWTYQDEVQKQGKEAWQAWREKWPNAKVERMNRGSIARWQITAPILAHRELVAPLAPPPPKTTLKDPQKLRFSGRYRGELSQILQSLAQQLKLELQVPDLSPQALRQELDLTFEQASLDEILDQISKASGLRLRRDDKTLILESD
jgi:hypothetical protein